MKRKILSLLALLLCAATILSACGGEPVTLMEFIKDMGATVDYGGYKFKYYFEGGSDYEEDKSILSYDTNTQIGEEMLQRIQDIKDEINVEFVFDHTHDYASYQLATMGGSLKADAISFSYMNAMQVFANGGFLFPVTDFPDYIDLNDTDKYGAANVLEPAMVNSVPYAVLPCFWPGYQPLDSYILVYNKNLTIPNGIADFHEFWESETWTWDTYEKEFLDKAKVETSSGYIYSMSMVDIQYFSSLLYSNNVQFVTRNAAGENVINPYPESFVRAYEKGLEWANKYKDTICFESGVYNIDNFLEEAAMVGLASASAVTTGDVAYKAKFDYGLMPFPAGPDAPYGVWAQYMQRINGVGIATTSEEPEIAAHTISLWFEPFEEFGGRDGLYDYYDGSIFLTETDTEIYFALMENVRYDYTFWDQRDVGRQVHSDFGGDIRQGVGIAESMERNRNTINEMVYDFIEPNFDYMYDNYYYQFDN